MPRYFVRRAPVRASLYVENDHYGRPQDHTLTVDEHVPTFTGILDASGEEIWREPRSIGFGRRNEW
jgi:hypothetical protein